MGSVNSIKKGLSAQLWNKDHSSIRFGCSKRFDMGGDPQINATTLDEQVGNNVSVDYTDYIEDGEGNRMRYAIKPDGEVIQEFYDTNGNVISETVPKAVVTGMQNELNYRSCVGGLKNLMNKIYGNNITSDILHITGNAWNLPYTVSGKMKDFSNISDLKVGDIVVMDRDSFASDSEKGIPDKNQHVGAVTKIQNGIPYITHYIAKKNAKGKIGGRYRTEPINRVMFDENVQYVPSKVISPMSDPSKTIKRNDKIDQNFFGWDIDNESYNPQMKEAMKALIDVDWSKLNLEPEQARVLANRTLAILGAESDFGAGPRSMVRNMFPTMSNLFKEMRRGLFTEESEGYGSLKGSRFRNVYYSDIDESEDKTRREKSKETYDRYVTPDMINMISLTKKGMSEGQGFGSAVSDAYKKTFINADVRKNSAAKILNALGVNERNVGKNIKNDAKAVLSILVDDLNHYGGDDSLSDEGFRKQLTRYNGSPNDTYVQKANDYYNSFANGKNIEGKNNIYSFINNVYDNGANIGETMGNMISYMLQNTPTSFPQFSGLLVDIMGDGEKHITENMLSEGVKNDFIQNLDLYRAYLEKNGMDTNSFSLQYVDENGKSAYDRSSLTGESNATYDNVSGKNIATAFFDSGAKMQQLLGQAHVDVDENGDYIITDRYNFNDQGNQKNLIHGFLRSPSLYGIFRKIGTEYGSPENMGPKVNIKLKHNN